MKFLKTYDEVKMVPNSPGNAIEKTYVQRYKKDGTPYLEESGTKNNVEIVRSFKDVCDYEKLIKRYTQTGDISLLQRSSGVYADMSEFPGSLIEAYDVIKRAENVFYSLPIETKEFYGNSFSKFLADFGSENWLKAFGIDSVVKNDEVVTKESEVKDSAE